MLRAHVGASPDPYALAMRLGDPLQNDLLGIALQESRARDGEAATLEA